jgi:hypothetical protein
MVWAGAKPLKKIGDWVSARANTLAFRFFTVPIQNAEQAEAELNEFLRSHKVLPIDRRWVEQGSTSFWTFCVDYLDGQATGSGGDRGARGKVDYKEVLSPEEFTVFAKLREVRKEIAQAEAVPVYTIFTNEQSSLDLPRAPLGRPMCRSFARSELST